MLDVFCDEEVLFCEVSLCDKSVDVFEVKDVLLK